MSFTLFTSSSNSSSSISFSNPFKSRIASSVFLLIILEPLYINKHNNEHKPTSIIDSKHTPKNNIIPDIDAENDIILINSSFFYDLTSSSLI